MKKAKKWFFGLLSGMAVFLLPLTAYAAEAEETLGEKMTTAVFNTILGIGTVFIMLIVIALIIYCFRFIPGLVDRFTKKKASEPEQSAKAKPVAKPAPAPAAAPAAAPQTDDLELVAVIAAAIAASEQVPLDSFVVRTIRRWAY